MAKKAAKKKVGPKKSAPKKKVADTTPVADPCAAGHQWDTDGDGEFCTICRADRKMIEKPSKKKAATAKPTEGKLSALDAAAQVLAESTEPLNAKQMIEAMAAKGLWTSPGGKTPHATLYSAILREIQVKGKDARFRKTDRGHFAAKG